MDGNLQGKIKENSMAPAASETSFNGVAVAVVTDNKDPDDLCRVKIRYPYDNPSASWTRLAMPMAGNRYGADPGGGR